MWLRAQFAGFPKLYRNYLQNSYVFDCVTKLKDNTITPECALYVPLLDLKPRKLTYVNLRDVPKEHMGDYLCASICLPPFVKPITIGGSKFIDGALIDNIPVRPLLALNFDYAVVIHFDNDNFCFENSLFNGKLIKINFKDGLLKTSFSFDRQSVSRMIYQGYERAKLIFSMVLEKGTEDIEFVHKRIRQLDDMNSDSRFRLTGDVVVDNMNKLMKKIVRYDISD